MISLLFPRDVPAVIVKGKRNEMSEIPCLYTNNAATLEYDWLIFDMINHYLIETATIVISIIIVST